jgi:hypothetical protein
MCVRVGLSVRVRMHVHARARTHCGTHTNANKSASLHNAPTGRSTHARDALTREALALSIG